MKTLIIKDASYDKTSFNFIFFDKNNIEVIAELYINKTSWCCPHAFLSLSVKDDYGYTGYCYNNKYIETECFIDFIWIDILKYVNQYSKIQFKNIQINKVRQSIYLSKKFNHANTNINTAE